MPTRMTKKKKKRLKTNNIGEDVGQLEPSNIAGGNVK